MIAVLADLLREAARSAQDGDEERAVATLTRARDEESSLCDLRAAAEEGLAIVASTPFRRRSDQDVRLMADLVVPLDRALTNARVLVRRSVQLARSGRRLPPKYADLVEQLADAVLEIESELRIARTPIVARGSLVAVGEATARVPRSADLSVEVILAQVRSIVVDLLQAIGLDQDAALDALPRLPDGSDPTQP